MSATHENGEQGGQLRLRELVDHIPGGIGIFDLYRGEAHQVYLNDSFYELISDRRENRVYPSDTAFFKNVHPDDYPLIQKAVADLEGGAESASFDYRTKNSRHSYTWLHLTAKVVSRAKERTTIYCCFMDIGEAMAAREALEKTNAMIRTQYARELERRKILEKGSFVNTCINITKERVLAVSCVDDRFQNLPKEFDCKTAVEIMLETIPLARDRAAVEKVMSCQYARELLAKGITDGFVEYRSYQPDGALHWIRVAYDIIRDIQSGDIVSFAYYYDIDEEKKARLTLGCVVDEEIDYVMLYSLRTHQARFVHANVEPLEPALRQSFALERVCQSDAYQRVLTEDRAAVDGFFSAQKLAEALEHTPVVTVMYRKRTPGGKVRRKKARAFYLDETRGDIVIARRDITDLYEEEQQQKRVLREAADEAIQANRAKSEFLARMSHDMRTPMNGILGIAALMREQTDLKEIRENLAQLELSGQYLLRLINDTLDMNKVESGKLALHPQPMNGEQIFRNVIANASLMAKEKGVELQMIVPPIRSGEWTTVVADSARLEQIMLNVISNAVKFSRPGGRVTLTMETVSATDEMVVDRYRVRDDGIGMSEAFLPRLFEPFSQEERANTEPESGTGLGMSIVKQLVRLMGGEITVTSRLNEGTEVVLLMRYPVFHEQGGKTPARGADISALKDKRILLCEDHPLNARIAAQLLVKRGMTVERAENGMEGVEKFRSSPEGYYDAVLMDIRMPVMDGLEAAARIRGLGRADAKTVPIIALTANAYEEDVQKTLAAGMNAHLAKPVSPKELYETLLAQTQKRARG